jgi:hypothetical protein
VKQTVVSEALLQEVRSLLVQYLAKTTQELPYVLGVFGFALLLWGGQTESFLPIENRVA